MIIQLVNKQTRTVVQLCKVKSVEYQLLRLLQSVLSSACERNDVENGFERIFQSYTKQHRALVKNVKAEDLPHPESYYSDLFSTAFALINSRKTRDWQEYRRHLLQNPPKFLTLVMKENETRNAGTNKYHATIDLESHMVLQQPEKVSNAKAPAAKPARKEKKPKVIEETKAPEEKPLEGQKLTILVAPPLALSNDLLA